MSVLLVAAAAALLLVVLDSPTSTVWDANTAAGAFLKQCSWRPLHEEVYAGAPAAHYTPRYLIYSGNGENPPFAMAVI